MDVDDQGGSEAEKKRAQAALLTGTITRMCVDQDADADKNSTNTDVKPGSVGMKRDKCRSSAEGVDIVEGPSSPNGNDSEIDECHHQHINRASTRYSVGGTSESDRKNCEATHQTELGFGELGTCQIKPKTHSTWPGSSTATGTIENEPAGDCQVQPTMSSARPDGSTATGTTENEPVGDCQVKPKTSSTRPGSSTASGGTENELVGDCQVKPKTSSTRPGSSTATGTTENEPVGDCQVKRVTSGADAAEKQVPHDTSLYFEIHPTQWPVVYTAAYNIGFLGLEKLHPFDSGKWGRIHAFLKERGMIRDDTTVQPREAQEEDLLVVHPKSYVDGLKWSAKVAAITEVPPVALLPNYIVQRRVLRPFRYHTGGSILAAKIAVDRGWAINLGGGFHHCSAERGGGFCAYADITLAIRFLLLRDLIQKAMIIDLDAHQGNGHERDFMTEDRVYILDVYNRGIYPHDGYAKRGITRKVELNHYTEDEEYLQKVRTNVEGALNEFTPDLVVYNAGTDILDGDPLGCLSITAEGIKERDQIVFQKCRTRSIPIVMVTSGGYQRSTAQIIADSIYNLYQLGLIGCEEAENAPPPKGACSVLG